MPVRTACLVSGVAFLLASAAASARGELQAGPTLLELQPGATSTRLRLGNSGDVPVAAQIRIYAWIQEGGEDRLTETDAVVASPPIAEVAADGEQLVRLVRTGPQPAADRDEAFRVVVDELPGPPDDAGTGVRVRMRFVLPLFVRASVAVAPDLSCRLLAGGTRLACRNAGGQAAQLGASRLVAGDTGQTLSEGLFGYVLPGSERQWALPKDRPALAGALTLDTIINGQPATVAVDRQP